MVGQHTRMQAGLFGSIFRPPWDAQARSATVREKARELLDLRRAARAHHDELADQPVLRRPAPGRDRPRAGLGPEAAAARRADGRHEPQESAELTEFMRKVRDERGITILLIEHDMKVVMGVSEQDHGARPRREDRRGRPADGPQRPARHRGLPREAGLTTAMAAARSRRHPHVLRHIEALKGISLPSTRARSSR